MAEISFPGGFLWGAATAAYQIEGGVHEGGRGESIWDRFSHTPGKVEGGDSGDVACDHYHRYREDVAIMADLGLHAYRFSIAWPRLFPAGGGKLNHAGLDFYQRLLDALLEAGIRPLATLYHWDLPQALQDKGGWVNRDTARYFADYASALFEKLGDRVKLWITHNEPWVTAFTGHLEGRHAPGLTDWAAALQAGHHLLLSHALAIRRFPAAGQAGKIGITLNLSPVEPATDTAADREAAARADDFLNRWFLEPLFHGRYPEELYRLLESRHGAPRIEPGDMERMAGRQPDFLGVNYYFRVLARAPGEPGRLFDTALPPGALLTDMGWEVHPRGLRDLLVRLHRDYKPPALYVTENGAAFPDKPDEAGRISDDLRLAYIREHLREARRAVSEEGVPLKGYFVWSLLDNFEWAYGYAKRFGIVRVEPGSLKRTWKESAFFYRDLIARNALDSD
jgi:beta-glucosidase